MKKLYNIIILCILILILIFNSYAYADTDYGVFNEAIQKYNEIVNGNNSSQAREDFENAFNAACDNSGSMTDEQKSNVYNFFFFFDSKRFTEIYSMNAPSDIAKAADLQERIKDFNNDNTNNGNNNENNNGPFLVNENWTPVFSSWDMMFENYKQYVTELHGGNFSNETAEGYVRLLFGTAPSDGALLRMADGYVFKEDAESKEEARIYAVLANELNKKDSFVDSETGTDYNQDMNNKVDLIKDKYGNEFGVDLDGLSDEIGGKGDKREEGESYTEPPPHQSAGNYTMPQKVSEGSTADTIDDVIEDADNFINNSDPKLGGISLTSIQAFSQRYYTIFFEIGVIVTVIVGLILGIKFIVSSTDQRAEVKKLLLPYVAGCIIIYGSFGIWKLVVTIITNNL